MRRRGGKRPGAGRKPGPVDEKTIASLAHRIGLETDPQRRVVVALSALGAEPAIIAAVLDMEESVVVAAHSNAIETGRLIMTFNSINLLWRQAKRGNVRAIIHLERLGRNARADQQ